jgi:DNA-binding transcriptional LysR family regulator
MLMVAVMPKSHRLSRRAVVDVADLMDDPLLRLGPGFASYNWFDAACRIERVRPRVLLESITPHTLIALARTGLGIAMVNSVVRIPSETLRAAIVAHRGKPIGRWTVVAWNRQRFLPLYAEQFVEELILHCRSDYPGRELVRKAPRLPKAN